MSQSTKFLIVLAVGISLVGVQGLCAWLDGFFSQAQLQSRGVHGYSFLQHGGMWADVLVVTPIVAWITSRYELPYVRWPGLLMLAIALAFSLFMLRQYEEWAKLMPEAHTHDGVTTPAGWIHGLYAVVVFYVVLMFYFCHVEPKPGYDMMGVSVGLTALFVLGTWKFHPDWHWRQKDTLLAGGVTVVVWVVTIVKMMV